MRITIDKDSKPEKIIAELYKLPTIAVGEWQFGDSKPGTETLLCLQREYIITDKEKDIRLLGTKKVIECLVFYATSEKYQCIVHCDFNRAMDWVQLLKAFSGQKNIRFVIAGGQKDCSHTQEALRWIIEELIKAAKKLKISMSSKHQFITTRHPLSSFSPQYERIHQVNMILMCARRAFFQLYGKNIDLEKLNKFITENNKEIISAKIISITEEDHSPLKYFYILLGLATTIFNGENKSIYEKNKKYIKGIQNETTFYDLLQQYLLINYQDSEFSYLDNFCQFVNISDFIFSADGEKLIPISHLASTPFENWRMVFLLDSEYKPFHTLGKDAPAPQLTSESSKLSKSLRESAPFPRFLTFKEYQNFFNLTKEEKECHYLNVDCAMGLLYEEFPVLQDKFASSKHLEIKKEASVITQSSLFSAESEPGYEIRSAAASGNKEKLEELITRSPELINSTGKKSGKTALHFAVEHAQLACITLLLKKNTSRTIMDAKGKTPVQYAPTKHAQAIDNLFKTITAVSQDKKEESVVAKPPFHSPPHDPGYEIRSAAASGNKEKLDSLVRCAKVYFSP